MLIRRFRASNACCDYGAAVRRTESKAAKIEASVRRVDAKFLAEKYNVSTRLILLMAADRRIPSIRIGRCVRFDEAAVAKVLEG